jgi:hypothetical protein
MRAIVCALWVRQSLTATILSVLGAYDVIRYSKLRVHIMDTVNSEYTLCDLDCAQKSVHMIYSVKSRSTAYIWRVSGLGLGQELDPD